MSQNTKTEISKNQLKNILIVAIIGLVIYFGFMNPPKTQNEPSVIAEASFEDLRNEKQKQLDTIASDKKVLELKAQKVQKEKEIIDLDESLKAKGQEPTTNTLASVIATLAPTLEHKIKVDDRTELPSADLWVSRIEEHLTKHNSPLKGQSYGKVFVDLGLKYKIHPYVAVAIGYADTSLGKSAVKWNWGNVGAHDSKCLKKCPDIGLRTWNQGIEAVYKALNNKFLGKASLTCELSRGGWNYCSEGATINNGKFYASSVYNWHNNVTTSIADMEQAPRNNKFNYRI